MSMLVELGYLSAGAFLGCVIGVLYGKLRFGQHLVQAETKLAALQEQRHTMVAEMEKVAVEVSRQNSHDFLLLAEQQLGKVKTEATSEFEARKKEVENLVRPITDQLSKLEVATNQMELNRKGAYASIETLVSELNKRTIDLGHTNTKLETALRGSSQTRGAWGQITMRNIAEASGMLEHCDFDVEMTLKSGVGGGRVDMLVKIPNGGTIPIDSKVPLASYWDSLEQDDDVEKIKLLSLHAAALKKHVKDLADRNYPQYLDGVDFTVMYIPAEPILAAAYEYEPTLQEHAFARHVLIVTPVTLMALLRTVSLYWQQQSMAENAKEIHAQARELYERVATFSEHLAKTGRGLATAVNAYNDAVGSFDVRVIPSGKQLEQLRVVDNVQKQIQSLPEQLPPRTMKHLDVKPDTDGTSIDV